MKLLTSGEEIGPLRGACRPMNSPASASTSVPTKKEKQKREADRKHDIPLPAERDMDESGVIGEVDRPPPPSEKPEAA
jgi:hypothetical protein